MKTDGDMREPAPDRRRAAIGGAVAVVLALCLLETLLTVGAGALLLELKSEPERARRFAAAWVA